MTLLIIITPHPPQLIECCFLQLRIITTPLTEEQFDAAAAARPAACSINRLCHPDILGPPPPARCLLAAHPAERGATLAGLEATEEGRLRLRRMAEAVRALFAPVTEAAGALVEDLTGGSAPASPGEA